MKKKYFITIWRKFNNFRRKRHKHTIKKREEAITMNELLTGKQVIFLSKRARKTNIVKLELLTGCHISPDTAAVEGLASPAEPRKITIKKKKKKIIEKR